MLLLEKIGILEQATKASVATNKASALEDMQFEAIGAFDNDGKFDITKMKSNLANHLKATYQDYTDGSIIALYSNYYFIVDKNGNTNFYAWKQNKSEVTNGVVTLFVGQEIDGYSANDIDKWYVLGAKDDKLVITTNENVTTVELFGKDGYVNGVEKINEICQSYKVTSIADTARAIDIDDLIRVAGYDSNSVVKDETELYQNGNKVKYTLKGDGHIWYEGLVYAKEEKVSNRTSFTYWTGENWKSLNENETVTLETRVTGFRCITTNSSYEGIVISNEAHNLLFNFSQLDTAEKAYWLGTTYIGNDAGWTNYGVSKVIGNGVIENSYLYQTNGNERGFTYGVRPVISLKLETRIDNNGQIN
ncbi:MAG: hypothetical protein IJ867_04595 [Clostridia bacterium]|nr:hypothetical protein [Clostridia bacterium]